MSNTNTFYTGYTYFELRCEKCNRYMGTAFLYNGIITLRCPVSKCKHTTTIEYRLGEKIYGDKKSDIVAL